MSNADMPAMAQSMVLDQYENRIIVSDIDHTSMGLTKLEHFAGLAMQGIMANDQKYLTWSDLAKDAVSVADALLKELEQDK